MTKVCKKCGVERTLDRFRKRDGKRTEFCYESVCKDCVAKSKREKYDRDPTALKMAQLKWNYGITEFEFNGLRKSQDDKCAICRREFIPGSLCVDHCHFSGKVRGLLCKPCNMFIALIGEDTSALVRAIEYLQKNS